MNVLGTVLVTGSPGAGKRSLLEAFERQRWPDGRRCSQVRWDERLRSLEVEAAQDVTVPFFGGAQRLIVLLRTAWTEGPGGVRQAEIASAAGLIFVADPRPEHYEQTLRAWWEVCSMRKPHQPLILAVNVRGGHSLGARSPRPAVARFDVDASTGEGVVPCLRAALWEVRRAMHRRGDPAPQGFGYFGWEPRAPGTLSS